MILAFRHAGIVVEHLDRMQDFYVTMLGFKVERRALESSHYIQTLLRLRNVRLVTVKMSAPGGGQLELLHFESHPSKAKRPRKLCAIGLTHIALTVDNLAMEYRRLSRGGVKFSCVPMMSADCSAKVAMALDPESNYLELVEEIKC